MDNVCDSMAYSLTWEDAMKRDMDLARMILLKIEESEDPESIDWMELSTASGYVIRQVNYHLKLLQNAGLIDAKSIGGLDGGILGGNIEWAVQGLTWNGHEFVEAAKNTTMWENAKSIVIDKVGSPVFAFLLQVLLELGRKQLGI